LKSVNLWNGKWYVAPTDVSPNAEIVYGVKSHGVKGSVKADLTFQVKGDKNRNYIISFDNSTNSTPEKQKIQLKVATNLTLDPLKIHAELTDGKMVGSQSRGIVKIIAS